MVSYCYNVFGNATDGGHIAISKIVNLHVSSVRTLRYDEQLVKKLFSAETKDLRKILRRLYEG